MNDSTIPKIVKTTNKQAKIMPRPCFSVADIPLPGEDENNCTLSIPDDILNSSVNLRTKLQSMSTNEISNSHTTLPPITEKSMRRLEDSPLCVKSQVSLCNYSSTDESSSQSDVDDSESEPGIHNENTTTTKSSEISHEVKPTITFDGIDSCPLLVFENRVSKRKHDFEEDEQCKKIKRVSSVSESSLCLIKNSCSPERPQMSKCRSRSLSEYNSNSKAGGFSTPSNSFWPNPSRSLGDQTPYSPLQRSPRFHYESTRVSLPSYDVSELHTKSFGVGFIDSHCHLDFLFKRTKHEGSYVEYREMLHQHFPISYEGCVAVFCDPVTFKQKYFWEPLIEEDGVWSAFGCHPHNAAHYTDEVEDALIEALKHRKVRALGEIGLDYSNRNSCDKTVQHNVFKRQLKIALQMELPLVIHSRDSDEDCFQIMKKIVPDNYCIHLHCFTGNWELAKMWLDGFPNLFMGITNVVTYTSATSVHEVVKNIPLDRLLLETDAPYFLPRLLPRSLKWSHPGMAIHVAAQIAALRQDVSLQDILRSVRRNTKSVYGI